MPSAEPQSTQRSTENHAAYTSRPLQALIKIYSLVDCPIYSVVKYRPHQLALTAPPRRVWIVVNPKFGANPLGVQLRIAGTRLTFWRSVRIHPTLDLRQSFLVTMNHPHDGDRASHQNRNDRNQQSTQAENGFDDPVHSLPPWNGVCQFARISGGADRDRTGGLLVANQALSQLSYSPINPAMSTWQLALSQPD